MGEKNNPPFCTNLNQNCVCALHPRPPIYMAFTKSRLLLLCGVLFVLPLGLSRAVPCCDKAEAGAGMAELTPARLGGRCVTLGSFHGLGVRSGPGPAGVPRRVVAGGCGEVVDAETLRRLPGQGETALFKTLRTAIVLPFLCRGGEGCCLWRFSMVLLNQSDRS